MVQYPKIQKTYIFSTFVQTETKQHYYYMTSRRSFLKTAAAATAAAAAAPLLSGCNSESAIEGGDRSTRLIVPRRAGLQITGTFLDEISHDIPHQNWGPKEWDQDFQNSFIITRLPTTLGRHWSPHSTCLCILCPNTASSSKQVHSKYLFHESVDEAKGLGLFLEELFQ